MPEDLLQLYAVHDRRNGLAVLRYANSEAWEDILAVLRAFRLHHTEIATLGGRKSLIADRLYGGFKARGWKEKRFDASIAVDGVEHPSPPMRWTCSRAGWRSGAGSVHPRQTISPASLEAR